MSTWNLQGMQHHLLICNGGSCLLKQGEEVTQAIRDEIAIHHADAAIHTTRTRCNGRCDDACVVIHYPEGTWYKEVTPEIGRSMVQQLLGFDTDLKQYCSYTYDRQLTKTGEAPVGITKV